MDPKCKPESLGQNYLDVGTVIDAVPPLAFIVSESNTNDINGDMAISRRSIVLHPPSRFKHVFGVYMLAAARFDRYKQLQKKEDLDKAIVHFTEAIFLPPASRTTPSPTAVHLFHDLTFALLVRSERFADPDDITYSIGYLRYLREFRFGSLELQNFVTESLVRALAVQVRSQAGDWAQNMEEMVSLCRELLTSDLSPGFPADAFTSLGEAAHAEFLRENFHFIDRVVECLRQAVKMCPPGSNLVLLWLANTLYHRFSESHSYDDYEEAEALLECVLDPNQPGGRPDSIRDQALEVSALLACTRSTFFQNPEYSEVAISRLRTFLSLPSLDETRRHHANGMLVLQTENRFNQYSLAESLEEMNSSVSQVVDLSSSQSLEKSGNFFLDPHTVQKLYSMTAMTEKIQNLEELLSGTPPGTESHQECLILLTHLYESKSNRTHDISDIEEVIKYSRMSLDATSSRGWWRILSLKSLSSYLFLAFKKTGKISYLNEAITAGYDVLELKNAQGFHFAAIDHISTSLVFRADLLGGEEDLYEAIRLISMFIDNQYARDPDRCRLSCRWAIIARYLGHPSVWTAYKSAMSSMQKSFSFAPTVSIQHTQLVEMDSRCLIMPLDYASFHIDSGRFEDAVQTLEQGRALLWSEMRGLRTAAAQLQVGEGDLPLVKRYTEINQELEALTISVTPSARLETETEDRASHGSNWTDPFGQLVIKRQKLLEERDVLVSQIRGRPGLQGFLETPSFSTLRTAALRGPVVIINHCIWRCDILIIFHNSLPCSISTASDFYVRGNTLRDELVQARKYGLDSSEYQDALSSVLKTLYELVGAPVIKRLRALGVPEQSRIWWCPTSVFCSLPLHAMGPIPSIDGREQYFSDLYIPSYTPSLSALMESRNPGTQILDRPSLLLVAQPGDSLPGVNEEIKAIRSLKGPLAVTDLVANEATPSSVLEGLKGSQFSHFACHGVLEIGKPFDASFMLHGGLRLTLLDIVQSRLPEAEFAFLSCCHTAEITGESIADEALHLTAAMQYCGFRSVVGTMWEMADTDGRDLAKSFYKTLFSSQETGVPYYERSAGALRDATQKLRGKRGITLERWVNFVHYGA